jgi:formiminotetrahydrofolate cyclodeaminase
MQKYRSQASDLRLLTSTMGGFKMLIELKTVDFVKEVASDKPAPGGGSVAALAGALSAALINMVVNFTVGKEKFKEQEAELKSLQEEAEKLQNKLTQYIDEDTESFNLVMEAFKMPKDTDEQKLKRTQAIQEAMKKAAELPLEVAKCCLQVIKFSETVVTKGNPNCLSDGGVGCLMAVAGVKGAIFNVKINLSSIKDKAYKRRIETEIQNLEEETEKISREVITFINNQLV